MIGTRLLHYVVEARLGAGGMGTVYLARDTVLDRTVAIKVLDEADGTARARLLREARAASALSHPNIVTVHAGEQQGDTAFIVMEHVEGVPLHRAIPEGGLPVAEAVRHAIGLAEALAAVVVLALASAALWWQRSREAQRRWVHDEAIPGISRLVADGDPVGAFRLAQRALAVAPSDPQLVAAWNSVSNDRSITSEPEGAEVAIRVLDARDAGWIQLGRTPLTVRLPFAQMRWRFTRDGYQPLEIIPSPLPQNVALAKPGGWPEGMVRVPAGEVERPAESDAVTLPGFFIDATEVTNRQFKAFIDAGGYEKREYWAEPFVDGDRTLPWEQAIARFRDTTGRPGPATWELGTFPDGGAELPVSGVSWYEAAAYARFAGKRLPTIYHWQRGDWLDRYLGPMAR